MFSTLFPSDHTNRQCVSNPLTHRTKEFVSKPRYQRISQMGRTWKLGRLQEMVCEEGARALFAEFLGTFMLVLIATGGINPRVIAMLGDSAPLFSFSNSVGVGMTVGLMIYLCADISGGHVNPSISLMFFLDTQISLLRLVCYTLAQFCGAFAAAGLLWWIGDLEGFTSPEIKIPIVKALIFQITGSWLMVLVTLAAIDRRRGPGNCFQESIIIGLSIVIGCMFMGPYVVTGLNPCVIAWYIVSGSTWPHLWILFLGPYLGSASAVGIYNGLLRPYKSEEEEKLKEEDTSASA